MLATLSLLWGKLKAIGFIASLANTLAKSRERKRLMEAGAAQEREKAKDEHIETLGRAARARPDKRVRKFDRKDD